ncbi:MAG: tetratricopeptide repeat protein [Ferruginibacter sp.]
MSDKNVTASAVETNEVFEKAKGFWAKFSKPIIYVSAAVILLGGGWLAYKNFVLLPKEEKSAEAIFPVEQIFDKMTQTGFTADSINLVLNGGNGITGVLKIADKFSGTAAANRCHFIAGACYLRNKEYDKAVKQLKEFSTDATQVQTSAYIMLGDAYAELKKNDDALNYYSKAASHNTKDEYQTSEALYKAGGFAEYIGKTKDAIEFYQKLKDNYPKSSHANDMDKYLARLGVTQ